MADRTTLQIFASTIEIVVSSKESNNTCCVFVEAAPPGGGPPPHRRDREEEVFTVPEGEFEFYADGRWSPMTPGVSRLSLRGTYHAFRNVGSTPGRMMLVTTGGGIDDYFREISGLKIPEDADRLAEVSRHYGYFFLGPADG